MVKTRNKPSKAQELARQAAAAAQAEMADSAPAATGPSRWSPQALTPDFQLDRALDRAVGQAAGHLQRLLGPEGLAVTTVPQGAPQGLTPSVEGIPGHTAVQVIEDGTGRVVRGYSTGAVLGLFASQQQRSGVVIDGQV